MAWRVEVSRLSDLGRTRWTIKSDAAVNVSDVRPVTLPVDESMTKSLRASRST